MKDAGLPGAIAPPRKDAEKSALPATRTDSTETLDKTASQKIAEAAAEFEAALRSLHEFVSEKEVSDQVESAKNEYFQRVGAPLPEEPIYELRLAGFVEWFMFDRKLEGIMRTPLEQYMRKNAFHLDRRRTEVLIAMGRNVHSIFLVKKRNNSDVDLKDLHTGIKYKGVKRVPATLAKGDLAELRLVLYFETAFCMDTICFHPYSAAKHIKRVLKRAMKRGEPMEGVIEGLTQENTRYERLPRKAKKNAYAGE